VNGGHLRLLFVIKSLGIRGGGAERVLCDVCSELADRGHSVEVVSFDQAGSADFYQLSPRIERSRLALGKTDAPTGLLEFVRRTAHLRSLLGKSKPDVAIGFMHSAFVPLAIAARGVAVPVIASEHIAYRHYGERPLQKLLVRAIAPLCQAFTVPFEDVRLQFPGTIARRMSVVPNPVTVSSRRRPGARRRKRLLFVGNFRAQKDHRTLIDAFASLALAHPTWDLHLVGGGELRAEVEAQVERLGLHQRIAFAGAVKDMSAEYAAADLFVVPSTYESFGLAAAEALASGIPVVGFADCPGTSELVEDGRNGLLVDGRDRVEALAAGLERLMNSSELRNQLGKAAPQSVKHYSIAAIADAWEELLWAVRAR
jgi:glycosyltransferase involved in cell wall biosynthesis